MPEELWERIKELAEKQDSNEVVSFEVTSLNKNERTCIHQAIKRCFERRITSNTVVKDDKKFVEMRKFNKSSKCIII